MATEGVSKAHAVELLREGLPASSTSAGRKPPKVNSRALLPAPFEPGTSDADLLEQVVAFYHRALREAPQPAAYLERRKLADSEMVEVFRLTFADGSKRTRRDHVKYLTLIRAIALLHQHQRPKKSATTRDGRTVTYIEATTDDIALANRLAHEVLGQSLDELPPRPRRLLEAQVLPLFDVDPRP